LKIYKTVVRPVMTYTAETRTPTETAEMKILHRITGNTLLHRERSENFRTACNVKNINDKQIIKLQQTGKRSGMYI